MNLKCPIFINALQRAPELILVPESVGKLLCCQITIFCSFPRVYPHDVIGHPFAHPVPIGGVCCQLVAFTDCGRLLRQLFCPLFSKTLVLGSSLGSLSFVLCLLFQAVFFSLSLLP